MTKKESKPLVSVVMTTWNGQKTIKRAIISALNQTYPNIEMIVVDDASEDNTYKVAKDIEDPRLTVLQHEVNRNGSAGRNTGIKASKGEYIAFLDDDDEWLPTKIEKQVGDLQKKNMKVSLVSHFNQKGDGWKEVIINKEGDLTKGIFLMELSLAAGSALLIHRDVIDKVVGFNEGYARHQDMEFLLRILRSFKVSVVKEPLVRIYGHMMRIPGSQGKGKVDKVANLKDMFLTDFKQDIEKFGKKISKKIYARQWLQIARMYAGVGSFKETIKHLFKSLSFGMVFSNRIKVMPHESYFAIPLYLSKATLVNLKKK